MERMVQNGEVQYKTTKGSQRASVSTDDGFSIYQLSLWWADSDESRPTDSQVTFQYSYTQSLEDWKNTVEYSGNFLSTCKRNCDGSVTKTYVVSNAGTVDPINTDVILLAQPTSIAFTDALPAYKYIGSPPASIDGPSKQIPSVCSQSLEDLQAQLNKWVDEWDVPTYTGCNLAPTVIETTENETHDFMIRHGGCNLRGIKAKFNIPSNVDLS